MKMRSFTVNMMLPTDMDSSSSPFTGDLGSAAGTCAFARPVSRVGPHCGKWLAVASSFGRPGLSDSGQVALRCNSGGDVKAAAL
eukprot:CAMPEP_0195109812 /NCGR_PEP_ID=MMETSP0448-20130528/90592_1 /TAXON_ID=66468 /ORGANISM="Heterocapsa triquestra, Strain CCMP 448" /LENGTH=83 /DNA_ID=CAMNT_0040146467 /DNA_START=271 /DNA_END=522 /DNA_ORIENTATION=-